MAKKSYKIPTSLDRSFLDHEIALKGGGFQMKPLPMKVILFWVVSIFILFWLMMNSLLKSADWWINALIIVWWIIATAFFGAYSKAKEMKFMSVPALFGYLGKQNKVVNARRSADPSAFYSVAPIESIDDGGLVTWVDGTVGQAYLVAGSASLLVFDQDKLAILERVDSFWRKVDTTAEFITVTTKEPQRVWRQMAALERQNRALDVRDPELFELMEEKYDILKDYVGGTFSSIHQYIIIKADNLEALRRAHAVLAAEADESSLMVKQLTMLDKDDAQEMLRAVYAGLR